VEPRHLVDEGAQGRPVEQELVDLSQEMPRRGLVSSG
jgi:hypothetical protein